MMHLDTVMTMIDRTTFVLYPFIDRHPRSWTITPGGRDSDLKVTHNRNLWDSLAAAMGVDEVTVLITDETSGPPSGSSGTTGTTTWPSPPA